MDYLPWQTRTNEDLVGPWGQTLNFVHISELRNPLQIFLQLENQDDTLLLKSYSQETQEVTQV